MSTPEERIVLDNLSDLLSGDLATVEDEVLVAGIRDAENLATLSMGWSGRLVAELKKRYSWREVVELTGVPQTTLHNRMHPRPARSAPDEQRRGPRPATTPEHPPVVAAIVTSHLGVLCGRRHDAGPLWTFIAGKIEPGESQVDAAVREVKEETGLQVRAGHQEIGRRVHPSTGVTMIYLACSPVESTDVYVGDEKELAEVRWLSLAEVDTLMEPPAGPGVFAPVREHLAKMIN